MGGSEVSVTSMGTPGVTISGVSAREDISSGRNRNELNLGEVVAATAGTTGSVERLLTVASRIPSKDKLGMRGMTSHTDGLSSTSSSFSLESSSESSITSCPGDEETLCWSIITRSIPSSNLTGELAVGGVNAVEVPTWGDET